MPWLAFGFFISLQHFYRRWELYGRQRRKWLVTDDGHLSTWWCHYATLILPHEPFSPQYTMAWRASSPKQISPAICDFVTINDELSNLIYRRLVARVRPHSPLGDIKLPPIAPPSQAVQPYAAARAAHARAFTRYHAFQDDYTRETSAWWRWHDAAGRRWFPTLAIYYSGTVKLQIVMAYYI